MSNSRVSCLIDALILVPLAAGTLSNCSSQPSANSSHRDSNFIKSPTEIAALEKKAASGDGKAAWDLFGHYGLGLRDEAKAEPWLQRAAQLGNPKAKRYIEIRNAG
jgi:hypothetical protein